jgi:hypothetical protein
LYFDRRNASQTAARGESHVPPPSRGGLAALALRVIGTYFDATWATAAGARRARGAGVGRGVRPNGRDKYIPTAEDNIMDTTEPQDTSSTDDRLDAQRDIIRQSLDAIANDIGMTMRDVGLTFPLYITVRNSGDALVTMMTPLDPSDTDWQRAREIVCRTLEERVGCGRLGGRELACAIANAAVINAADVTAD